MEIIQQLETILNEGATVAGAPFRFEVADNLAYLDTIRRAIGLELIPVLTGSSSGTYLPLLTRRYSSTPFFVLSGFYQCTRNYQSQSIYLIVRSRRIAGKIKSKSVTV